VSQGLFPGDKQKSAPHGWRGAFCFLITSHSQLWAPAVSSVWWYVPHQSLPIAGTNLPNTCGITAGT